MSISHFKSDFYPQSRHENLLVQDVENETLVYDLASNKAYCLNRTAAAVWSACNGRNDLHQIVNFLKSEHQIESNEDLILLSIHELKKNNLLVENPPIDEAMTKFDRRGMIRRLAMGTAFALPVIVSLVVPTAIQAASGPLQGSCMSACTVGQILPCACSITHPPCPPGFVFNASLGLELGVCVSAVTEVTLPLGTVGGGAQVNFCLIADACLMV